MTASPFTATASASFSADAVPHGRGRVEGRQSRARHPDEEGYVEREGVRIFYEVYGAGERTVLLLPTWSIVHSRFWKAQIPYLSRHFRVLAFDGRGNGRSDRPRTPEAYSTTQFADDAIAVMDATGTDSATLVSLSCGALWATLLAAEQPGRVDGSAYIAPAVGLAPNLPERDAAPFEDRLSESEGWARYNAHYWRRDYRGFLEFFFAKCFTEPHSTKQIEDCIGWALETDPETLIDTTRGTRTHPRSARVIPTSAVTSSETGYGWPGLATAMGRGPCC